jgi:hypothetical protein
MRNKRNIRNIFLPDYGLVLLGDVGLGFVAGGINDHALRFALSHFLPAVGVAGFFDERIN